MQKQIEKVKRNFVQQVKPHLQVENLRGFKKPLRFRLFQSPISEALQQQLNPQVRVNRVA